MQGSALVLILAAGSLGLAACARAPERTESVPSAVTPAPQGGGAQQAPIPRKSLAQRRFGGEITEKTSTALDALLREPTRFQAKTVRTEGVVSAVCKSMGCWMEISEPGGQAHIKMAGHSFFVPKDASGHRAIVQGTVVHADDACSEEAKEQTGAVAKVEIEATAVEFVD